MKTTDKFYQFSLGLRDVSVANISQIILYVLFLFQQVAISQVLPSDRSVNWTLAGTVIDSSGFDSFIDVLDYGVAGDGTTVNDDAILVALAAMNNSAGILFFPPGTYLFNSSLNIGDSIILRGSGSDSTSLKFNLGGTSANCINIAGTTTTDTTFINSNAGKDDTFIKVYNSTLFQVGDYIRILQNDADLIISSWANNSVGQIVKISSIAGNQINLSSPLRMDYNLSRTLWIMKIDPVKQSGIGCLKIEGTDQATTEGCNISFDYAVNCWLTGVESSMCNYAHVDVRAKKKKKIAGCYFHDAFDYGDGGKAYGTLVHHSSGECLIVNNIFKHLRHSMLCQAGANGNVFAYNYSRDPFWTGTSLPSNSAGDMVLHGNYPYANLFEGNIGQNIVIDNSHDINGINGPYNTFFRNRAELYGIFMNNNPASDNQNFIGNEVTNIGLYYLSGTGHFEFGNNIKGTVTPQGTNPLNDNSCYYTAQPNFLAGYTWPLIGIPNGIGTGSIPSKIRYDAGVLTSCQPDSSFLHITETMFYNTDFRIYPNPANKYLFVECMLQSDEKSSLQIFSILGKQLLKTNLVQGTNSINTSNLDNGIYLIEINVEHQILFKDKVVINNKK
ncbi:MAG: T9SS type A sorting domain-containing protein [Bacteroidia bacterium]|nr:T9SS type A sorting domain-containing protein [Bacteroidia bacterium]